LKRTGPAAYGDLPGKTALRRAELGGQAVVVKGPVSEALANSAVSGRVRQELVGQRQLDEVPLAVKRAAIEIMKIRDTVIAVADELGTTSAAVSLAWLRAREGTVVPILGPGAWTTARATSRASR
jgi:aryl-alcohol dehydrogenase-like predicted oxidoreductase